MPASIRINSFTVTGSERVYISKQVGVKSLEMIYFCWNCTIFVELTTQQVKCPECNADHGFSSTFFEIIEGYVELTPVETQQENGREIIYEFEEVPALKGPSEFTKTDGEIDACYICIENVECMREYFFQNYLQIRWGKSRTT